MDVRKIINVNWIERKASIEISDEIKDERNLTKVMENRKIKFVVYNGFTLSVTEKKAGEVDLEVHM